MRERGTNVVMVVGWPLIQTTRATSFWQAFRCNLSNLGYCNISYNFHRQGLWRSLLIFHLNAFSPHYSNHLKLVILSLLHHFSQPVISFSFSFWRTRKLGVRNWRYREIVVSRALKFFYWYFGSFVLLKLPFGT